MQRDYKSFMLRCKVEYLTVFVHLCCDSNDQDSILVPILRLAYSNAENEKVI